MRNLILYFQKLYFIFSFARRLLDMEKLPEKLKKQATKVVQKSQQEGRNALKLNFNSVRTVWLLIYLFVSMLVIPRCTCWPLHFLLLFFSFFLLLIVDMKFIFSGFKIWFVWINTHTDCARERFSTLPVLWYCVPSRVYGLAVQDVQHCICWCGDCWSDLYDDTLKIERRRGRKVKNV